MLPAPKVSPLLPTQTLERGQTDSADPYVVDFQLSQSGRYGVDPRSTWALTTQNQYTTCSMASGPLTGDAEVVYRIEATVPGTVRCWFAQLEVSNFDGSEYLTAQLATPFDFTTPTGVLNMPLAEVDSFGSDLSVSSDQVVSAGGSIPYWAVFYAELEWTP